MAKTYRNQALVARHLLFHTSATLCLLAGAALPAAAVEYKVTETDDEIRIETPQIEAAIRKAGYVSGVARQSFLDKRSGFRDPGFGLDIADWIMEPGSDASYRDTLAPELVYEFGNLYHGNRAKRSIEGPQICTRAKRLQPAIIRGEDFVAIRQSFQYTVAAPGKKTGSTWTQLIVFPTGKRYFVSMDRIDSVNDSDGMFLRIDMPGHIRHNQGDTFQEIYLSYLGGPEGLRIPAGTFRENFAPDAKFDYLRGENAMPDRFIRACRLREPDTGRLGPWLAGMTLDPGIVYDAWCHQRGYVCMIQEFGGRPIRAGQSFSAAFIVGYFDSIDEMHRVYDQHKGATILSLTDSGGWQLSAATSE